MILQKSERLLKEKINSYIEQNNNKYKIFEFLAWMMALASVFY